MTQLQSGSFRGSDVDGLDRVVHKMTDAAEFADDVVTALKILATALDMMSWTGWAAAFARYLRAVVIPWVKTVAQYLRGFAKVLALISHKQKDTSSDHPTVHIPGVGVPARHPARDVDGERAGARGTRARGGGVAPGRWRSRRRCAGRHPGVDRVRHGARPRCRGWGRAGGRPHDAHRAHRHGRWAPRATGPSGCRPGSITPGPVSVQGPADAGQATGGWHGRRHRPDGRPDGVARHRQRQHRQRRHRQRQHRRRNGRRHRRRVRQWQRRWLRGRRSLHRHPHRRGARSHAVPGRRRCRRGRPARVHPARRPRRCLPGRARCGAHPRVRGGHPWRRGARRARGRTARPRRARRLRVRRAAGEER